MRLQQPVAEDRRQESAGMKRCAKISILFEEVALLGRFVQARAAGFGAQRVAAQGEDRKGD
jgi:hypothetical protein